MPEPTSPHWADLAQSIADGEAVLVLGPDAIPLFRLGPPPDSDPQEPRPRPMPMHNSSSRWKKNNNALTWS